MTPDLLGKGITVPLTGPLFCFQGKVDRRKGQMKSPTDVPFIRGFSTLVIYFKPRVIYSFDRFCGGGESLFVCFLWFYLFVYFLCLSATTVFLIAFVSFCFFCFLFIVVYLLSLTGPSLFDICLFFFCCRLFLFSLPAVNLLTISSGVGPDRVKPYK